MLMIKYVNVYGRFRITQKRKDLNPVSRRITTGINFHLKPWKIYSIEYNPKIVINNYGTVPANGFSSVIPEYSINRSTCF
jgi:hypothetical protein